MRQPLSGLLAVVAGALIAPVALATPAAAKSVPINMTATIAPMGRSGVSGSAGLTVSGQMTALTVSLSHLHSHSKHALALREGRCGGAESGAAPFTLKAVQADGKGFALATHTYRGHIAGGLWHLNVYKGATATRARGTIIACGLLIKVASTPAVTHVSSNLGALIHAVDGSKVSGSAGILVSAKTSTTSLALTLSGLGPNSTHAAAFFTGHCGNKSATPFPGFTIANVQANAQGYVHANDRYSRVLALTSAHLHINVYADSTVPSAGESGVVACGNVVDLAKARPS